MLVMDMHAVRRKNLRDLISSQGDGTVASFARTSGLTEARLSQLLSRTFRSGQNFGEKMARKIEAQCGLPPLALDGVPSDLDALAAEGGLRPMREIMDEWNRKIPAVRTSIANSIPTTRDIDVLEFEITTDGLGYEGSRPRYVNSGFEKVGVRFRWLHDNKLDPEKLAAMKVRDDSMEPNLFEGDYIVVDLANIELADSAVFVIGYEGEIIVRRMSRDAGQWWITADSPDQRRFARKLFHDEGILIIGRVVLRETEWI